ncbi:MAG: metallophosphoesterase, partial [Candidatus Hydrogenedentes bacterium]|nr:metallophosphoesterase [Candidatus Hydrogenedentota bacterium]
MVPRFRSRMAALALAFVSFVSPADGPLDATMDAITTRLYEAFTVEQLRSLTEDQLGAHLDDDARRTLATGYWQFDVNVPVVVSVMRHVKQASPPSWLAGAGFAKTDLVVKNAECDFEVWQKAFDAGRVALGMNGFDGHRFCYFVCVGPQTPGAEVVVSNISPGGAPPATMIVGAVTYTDWTELVLTEVPASLRGHVLLATHRGRARETHLFGGFRETPFPSGPSPDQITLTWDDDPKTTQAISWRTGPSVTSGEVRYRKKGAALRRFARVPAAYSAIQDRMLANDRTSHRFTALLRDLEPGRAYTYQVWDAARGEWGPKHTFDTAPDDADSFSFVHLTDTHNRETAGKLLAAVCARTPAPAFAAISGDLVDMGLHRDCWDKLLTYLGAPI